MQRLSGVSDHKLFCVSPPQLALGCLCGRVTLSWLCRFLMRSKHHFGMAQLRSRALVKDVVFGRNDGTIRHNSW